MKISKVRLAIVFLALFLSGLVISITGALDNSKAAKANMDFNYMKNSDFLAGSFVKGRVYEIIGEYAYEEVYKESFGVKTNERVTSHFYLVPMLGTAENGDPMYISVEISHVDAVADAEKLLQQTWDFYENNTEPAVWNEFEITGEVYALDGELESLLYGWLLEGDPASSRADYESMICPYVIKHHSFDGSSNGIIFGVIAAVIGAIGLTVFVVIFLNSRNTVTLPPANQSCEPVPMGREYNPTEDSFVPYSSNTIPTSGSGTTEQQENNDNETHTM